MTYPTPATVAALAMAVSLALDPISHDTYAHAAQTESTRLAMSACTRCELHTTCSRVVPFVSPPHALPLALIGEAPGAEEDAQGTPFVGRSGQLLDRCLAAAHIPRSSVSLINTLGCRPPSNDYARAESVSAPVLCQTWFDQALTLSQAWILVPMGARAIAKFVPKLSVSDAVARGPRWCEYNGLRYLVVPSFHPAYLLRNSNPQPLAATLRTVRRILDAHESIPLPALSADAATPYVEYMGGDVPNTPASRRKFATWWKRKSYVPATSPIVGQVVIVADESTPVDAPYDSRPRYTIAELEILRRNSSMAMLAHVHAVKVALGGKVTL